MRLRHDAFAELRSTPPGPVSPRAEAEAVAAHDGLPEISRDELDADAARAAILTYGCVLVRGLVIESDVERLVDGIDRAFESYDAHADGRAMSESARWFEPFTPGPGYSIGMKRKWVRDAGGILAADSPRVLFDLLEAFETTGIARLARDYLGERPALSVNKCTLRRVPLDTSTDWHQDGAFLGRGIRTLDVWLSLSHCGVDAPGLDVVPRRLDALAETGTEGATFDWSVGPPVVERVAAPTPVTRPVFEPGDVLLFDDLFLHRTACEASMSRERYAVETWFFAPSTYPGGQIPLVL